MGKIFSHLCLLLLGFSWVYSQEVFSIKDSLIPNQDTLLIRKEKDYNTQIIKPDTTKDLPSISGNELLSAQVDTYGELSSKYIVRGGNYDENLVYVEGLEVYTPLLGRKGEQEGLSFINPDMVESINFSTGGWEAYYGDKLSSVLDLSYRKPRAFQTTLEASLIGGSLTTENKLYFDKEKSSQKYFSYLIGARYRNTNLLLNTLDLDAEINPIFIDLQSVFTLSLSRQFKLNFLSIVSRNRFEIYPNNRQVSFGTVSNPITVNVDYEGNEQDEYQSEMFALSSTYSTLRNKLKLTNEVFLNHGNEQEYFDIISSYQINSSSSSSLDQEIRQLDFGRNDLDFLIAGYQHRGSFTILNKPAVRKRKEIKWGAKFQNEDIRDLLNEWQIIDSADFLNFIYSANAKSNVNSNRFAAYSQYQQSWQNKKKDFFRYNVGLRATHWDYTNEFLLSPRLQFIYDPNWDRETDFSFSTGIFYQPPFYREIRDLSGQLQDDIRSQQSIHFTLGNNYYFQMMERKFRLNSEIYYKKLDNIIPFYIENVRVRYTGENNSEGFIYGFDTRLVGEIVDGAESWIKLSYTRSKENIDNRGYIPRPTDQRLRLTLMYQDFMPNFPWMKASLRLVYANGLPNGAPILSDPYDFQSNLADYRRADLGMTAYILNAHQKRALIQREALSNKIKEFTMGVEIFNLFNIPNEASNQYLRDVINETAQTVPNRLTGRFINLKLRVNF